MRIYQDNAKLNKATEASEKVYQHLAPRQYLLDAVVDKVLTRIKLTPLAIAGSWTANITGLESFPARPIPQASFFLKKGRKEISFFLPLPADFVKEEVALLFAQEFFQRKDHTEGISAWCYYEINGDIDFQLESKYL